MKFFIIILLVLLPSILFAQRNVVFIIDTLEGYSNKNKGNNSEANVQQVFHSSSTQIAETINLHSPPHVFAQMIYTDEIFIKLDDNGGDILLRVPESQLPDTVKINKWTIYKNGNTDTIKYSVVYWRCYNDSVVYDSSLEKEYIKTINHEGVQNLSNITIVINKHYYTIPIKKNVTVGIASGHGYKPHKKYKRYMTLKNSGKAFNKIFRFKRFHYDRWETSHYFEGSIDSLRQ